MPTTFISDAVRTPFGRYGKALADVRPDDLAAVVMKATIDSLNAMGHGVFARDSIGDVQALQFDRGRIVAVADPRHGGAAGGF